MTPVSRTRIGDAAASTLQAHSPQPLMHRAEAVDP